MNYVKVAVLESQFEATLVEQIMSDLGIPFVIRSYNDEVYGNLFQLTKGWGAIQAPASYKDQVTSIIEDVRASRLTEPLESEE